MPLYPRDIPLALPEQRLHSQHVVVIALAARPPCSFGLGWRVNTSKIEKKLPVRIISNRNRYTGSNH